ncbi:hypothetical protein BBO99_00001473 [Phytophthora kernoviae]|uniref:Uncharacterized protein n=2 Tax=Phytophthora kernoviae TaxID=325452 RepID=A0A421FF37_9STRA|nr:hypothetical protein G195_003141 [Phytophthora kernoviae 00238/432]KAG2529117.1 hypothetical protein JM16_002161 [Phytophthora kernoviae]KAG2532340.1 hypothetical protein JM18_001275 [Phytophthora kernoviae]RLN43855.1 hypothetical protein BBI17_001214 [Phytophthora kernoviae]RLN84259.1 hypothetical protein BBO99_00001473 [Phytophthora kernoviae]
MLRSHLDPARYVDPGAFEKYQGYRGQELVVSECVIGSPSEVFDAWLEEVWRAGGTELHAGVGRGCVGHVRRAALGVEEEILSVGLPIDPEQDDSDGGRPSRTRDRSKIPTICYEVRSFGLFPMQNQLALVQFVDVAASEESTPSTLVIWFVKTVPTILGHLLCCGGFTRFILRSVLQNYLGHRRLVSLGVEEQIESAGVPDSSDKIPSVSYSIKKSGPLLLSDHMALVQFVADTTAPPSAPKTLVLWNSKLTPSTAGSVLLCGGSISRLVLRTVLSSSLDSLAASFQNETRSM